MRICDKMVETKDTTVWCGMSVILSIVASSELLVQLAIVIFGPACSWLLLYYTQRLVAYREKIKGEKNNTKELEE